VDEARSTVAEPRGQRIADVLRQLVVGRQRVAEPGDADRAAGPAGLGGGQGGEEPVEGAGAGRAGAAHAGVDELRRRRSVGGRGLAERGEAEGGQGESAHRPTLRDLPRWRGGAAARRLIRRFICSLTGR
jgi:hypothetical protein